MLNASERAVIDAHVAAIEAATGIEVVTAVIGKADAYRELPWTAFAAGASLAALATVVADALRPEWAATAAALLAAVTILGAGGACALAAVFVPAFARLFLRSARRDLEVGQYARSLFLERELFRTRGRIGILLLVSLFERRAAPSANAGVRSTKAVQPAASSAGWRWSCCSSPGRRQRRRGPPTFRI